MSLAVFLPAGRAKEHPVKSGHTMHHSQFLCMDRWLQVFKITSNGTLKPIEYSYADEVPLRQGELPPPQADSILEMLPDAHGQGLSALWNRTYQHGSAVEAAFDRMQVSPRGKLVSVFHRPLPQIARVWPHAHIVVRQGQFLIVVSDSERSPRTYLQVYRIAPRGPRWLVSQTVARHRDFQSITADPTGHSVYLLYAHDSRIYPYSVLPNGALRSLGAVSVTWTKQPTGITFQPSRPLAYVTGREDNRVALYREGPEGSLHLAAVYDLGKPTVVSTLAPTLAITPNGHYLYVCWPGWKTFQYRILANGTLQPLTPNAIGYGGYQMRVDRTGRFAYSLSNTTGTNVIYQYRIQGDGTLRALQPRFVSLADAPGSMAIIQN